jgi:AraC-like DNA-binding protein
MTTIPVHDLMIKDLRHAEFDIIALNGTGERNYDGVVPHRHSYYELLVFSEGGGVHEVDFRDYDIRSHSLHFVSPTQVHKLKANTSKGFVLCFTSDAVYASHEKNRNFFDKFPFYDFNAFTPHLEVNEQLFGELHELVLSMNKIFYSDHTFKKEIIRSYLNIVLLKIKYYFLQEKQVSEQEVKPNHQGIAAFKTLVDKYYSANLNVQAYSDKLSLSPNYLNSLCKKETGKTAIQIIHERVLLEARRLLYSTNLSVKEISFALNFKDVAYFNRFFKKNMAITPSEYRQQTADH